MDAQRKLGRLVLALVAGIFIGGLLVSPSGAHITGNVKHLIEKHLKPAFYTKGQADSTFLGAKDKAVDADKLDGMDSSAFLGATAKAADADKLDGMEPDEIVRTAFAGAATPVLTFTGASDLLTVDITAPGAGVLLVTASVEAENFDETDTSAACEVWVDGALVPESFRQTPLDVSLIAGTLSTMAAVPVVAGEHTVAFRGMTLKATTQWWERSLSVIFVAA